MHVAQLKITYRKQVRDQNIEKYIIVLLTNCVSNDIMDLTSENEDTIILWN